MSGGYFFGNLPLVRDHLSAIVVFGVALGAGSVIVGATFKYLKSDKASWAVPAPPKQRTGRPMKALASILILLAGLLSPPVAATPGEVMVGGALREMPLRPFAGEIRSFAALRGKPLLINVWASYCGPCRAEMGSLERLSRRFGKQFNVVGVSIDDDATAARAFLAQTKVTFTNFHDQALALENMLGANMIPLTVFVDAQGRVLLKIRGNREWDSPENLKLIGETFRVKL